MRKLSIGTAAVVVFLFLLAVVSASDGWCASGMLTADETWSGTVTVTGDVTVPSDVTLTVLPGTTVEFYAQSDDQAGGNDSNVSELIVYGGLIAEGTEAEPIAFASGAMVPGEGDWGGITVVWELGFKTASLKHCDVGYGAHGLSFSAQSGVSIPTIENCAFHHSSGNGLSFTATDGAQVTIDINNTTISDNDGYGIYGYTEDGGSFLSGAVDGGSITGNGNNGVYIYNNYGRSNLSFAGITVSGNTTHGYNFQDNYTQSRSYYTVEDGAIFGNGTGIYIKPQHRSSATVYVRDNEIYQSTDGIYLDNIQGDSSYDQQSELSVSGNRIHDNSGYGVYCYAHYYYARISATVTSNEIYRNGKHGVYCIRFRTDYTKNQMAAAITLNSVYENSGDGLYLQTSQAVDILYNDIHDNTGCGMYLWSPADGSNLCYNNFQDNVGYALDNGAGVSINARLNYWGAAATAEMDAGGNPKDIGSINDSYDDGSRGTVDYSEWLSEAATIPSEAVSRITSPADGALMKANVLRIKGVAAAPASISRVEVSPDNGTNWYEASGKTVWYYDWTVTGDGNHTLLSRVIDGDGRIETPGPGVTITIDSALPTTSGALAADEEWSGEILITGDVTVPSGVTLTIAPGAVVLFQALNDDRGAGANGSRAELVVNGTLSSEGTEAEPIIFTSSSGNPAKGDWYGIRAGAHAANASIGMSHCTVEYAIEGLSASAAAYNATIAVGDSAFRNHSGNGMSFTATDGAQVTIDVGATTISDNDGYGIYGCTEDGGSVLSGSVEGGSVTGNGSNGVYIYNRYGRSDLTFDSVTVSGNTTYGYYFRDDYTQNRSYYTVRGGEIFGNGVGIYVKSQSCSSPSVYVLYNEIYQSADGIYLLNSQSNQYYQQSELRVSGNSIHDNSGSGIHCYTGYYYARIYADIASNEIYRNGSHGVYCHRHSHDRESNWMVCAVTLNQVYENGGCGLHLETTDAVDVIYNDIRDNAWSGLYLLSADDGSNVEFNNFDNSSTALDNGGGTSANARLNYWGAAATAEMDAGGNPKDIGAINDSYDDGSRGTVDYSEWLSEAATIPAEAVSRITSPADGSFDEGERSANQGSGGGACVDIPRGSEPGQRDELVRGLRQNSLV